ALGEQGLETGLVDEVTADRVLQVLLPVDLHGATDVALVVGAGVLVDLDAHDTPRVEVGLDPFGIHQDGGAAHCGTSILAAGNIRLMSRYISQPRQSPKAALRKAARRAAAVAPRASGVIPAT